MLDKYTIQEKLANLECETKVVIKAMGKETIAYAGNIINNEETEFLIVRSCNDNEYGFPYCAIEDIIVC